MRGFSCGKRPRSPFKINRLMWWYLLCSISKLLFTFRPLCCFVFLRSWRSWSASMIFTHKGQGMSLCQAAHLVWDNACRGRCSACVFWIVSHRLPKQLPKLHLMPIKPVSLPLPPGCMCNIKKSYLILPAHWLTFQKKVLGSCRWTLSPQSCSLREQCESIKMCVFPCKLSERACKNITKNSRSFWHQLRIRSPIISSIIEQVNKVSSSSGSEALHCTALQDVLSNDTLYLHLCCLPSKGVRFKRHWCWTRGSWRGYAEVGEGRFRGE